MDNKTSQHDNPKHSKVALLALEELLFWIGLATLWTGIDWMRIAGGILILASVILAFGLFNRK